MLGSAHNCALPSTISVEEIIYAIDAFLNVSNDQTSTSQAFINKYISIIYIHIKTVTRLLLLLKILHAGFQLYILFNSHFVFRRNHPTTYTWSASALHIHLHLDYFCTYPKPIWISLAIIWLQWQPFYITRLFLHKNKLIYYHISLPLWKKKLHCSIKVCRISSGILEYLVIFSNVSNSMRISVGHQHRAKFLLSILFWSALLLTLKNRKKRQWSYK